MACEQLCRLQTVLQIQKLQPSIPSHLHTCVNASLICSSLAVLETPRTLKKSPCWPPTEQEMPEAALKLDLHNQVQAGVRMALITSHPPEGRFFRTIMNKRLQIPCAFYYAVAGSWILSLYAKDPVDLQQTARYTASALTNHFLSVDRWTGVFVQRTEECSCMQSRLLQPFLGPFELREFARTVCVLESPYIYVCASYLLTPVLELSR